MDEELEWEEVVFDGDLFVDDPREAERHPARVEVAFVHEGSVQRAHSNDISPGGLFIVSDVLLPVDETFKLAFKLPQREEPARAVGRVAWVREEPGEGPDEPRGFGVQFVEIASSDVAAIEAFVELRTALLMDQEAD